ncbi:DNA adenine methylase [Terribacillus saccharophilus]|uniref:DNA adenine methylase n=1 Tax=Terribacillus saccharophilus TaxID=361277 RepID=UPI000BA7D18A|nr:DNA adenine methylase [Terribacillus saccharophilus]PAF15934.1 DNA methyltransferase [Terribacillus saccharophilus]
MNIKSPLIWFGGKSKYAKHIINRMPPHKIYIEPFGGAAHVIAQKGRANHEVYNDIDGLVVNFILQCIEKKELLIDTCSQLPYSRELYERWKSETMPDSEFARAVRFFYLNRCGISKGNADEVPRTGWRHSTTSNQNPADGYVSACSMIDQFSRRMRGVMIERLDFRDIIEKYDAPDALFYIDPPYVGREKYYAGEFSKKDHEDLARLLQNIKGKAIVSYYEDPMISELYSDWHRESFTAYRQVVGFGKETKSTELLLMNFEDSQGTIFDHLEESV